MGRIPDFESGSLGPPLARNRFQIVYLLVESSTIFTLSLE